VNQSGEFTGTREKLIQTRAPIVCAAPYGWLRQEPASAMKFSPLTTSR
jgi:hypothetical protein